MIIIINPQPNPVCNICGKPMDYRVIGLPDSEHSHPECEGKKIADEILKDFDKKLKQLWSEI